MLTADHDTDHDTRTARLDAWIEQVRDDPQLPALRSFAEGLIIDHVAVTAALALPPSKGPTEASSTRSNSSSGSPTAARHRPAP
jgi:transposase